MKNAPFFFLFLFLLINLSFSQSRPVARGAMPGEFYLNEEWYGTFFPAPPYYDTQLTAIYRFTEYGKKLTIQYVYQYLEGAPIEPDSVMIPHHILADATPGVIYAKREKLKSDFYSYTQLWVSFDHGKNWMLREENKGSLTYRPSNINGLLFRGSSDGIFKSEDYGNSFSKFEVVGIGMECGLQYGEGWRAWSTNLYQGRIYHSYDFYSTFTEFPIDSTFMYGMEFGVYPDVFRGALPEEVYIDSFFPDSVYKVSFSADTGRTFRHVFVKKCFYPALHPHRPIFMSDREPGVFYIIKSYDIEDFNPWGFHTKICVEYYRDYGETLVDTYCHDLTKDYKNNVGITEKGEGAGDEVVLYPNPTTGELQVTSYKLQVTSVEVFDVYGRKILVPPLTVLRSYDLTVLQPGIYFVRVVFEGGSCVKKVVKQ